MIKNLLDKLIYITAGDYYVTKDGLIIFFCFCVSFGQFQNLKQILWRQKRTER